MNQRLQGCLCCGTSPLGQWHRRQFLRGAGAAVAGLWLASEQSFADTSPTIGYESVPDLLKLPADLYLSE